MQVCRCLRILQIFLWYLFLFKFLHFNSSDWNNLSVISDYTLDLLPALGRFRSGIPVFTSRNNLFMLLILLVFTLFLTLIQVKHCFPVLFVENEVRAGGVGG